MTPTLNGRIQTRLVLVLVVGVPLALALGPFLPGPPPATPLADVYRVSLGALLLVAVVGIVWELVWHAAQQVRWEKDWPTLFGLLIGIPEGVLVWVLLRAGLPWDVGEVSFAAFLPTFAVLWVAIWLIANGPLQIFFIRWRFRGGRFF